MNEDKAATCPCGSAEHVIADHPDTERWGFTPRIGDYLMDDPVAEHRDGEHAVHADVESCPACQQEDVPV